MPMRILLNPIGNQIVQIVGKKRKKNGKNDYAHEFSVFSLQNKDYAKCWNQGKNGNQGGGPNAALVKVSEKTKVSNGMAHHMEQSLQGTKWFSQVELEMFVSFVAWSNACNALKCI